MRGINKVFIMGHLGHNPEIKTTPRGLQVCELAIATNRSRREGEEWVEETEWHHVTVFDQKAELARRFLGKGSAVAVEGRLRTESWEDKQTGQRRSRTIIIGEQLHLVGSRPPVRDSGGPAVVEGEREAPPVRTVAEDEIPF